jgi:hypothetical protein
VQKNRYCNLQNEAVMNGQKFVDVLKIVVRDGAASDELNVLGNPPGSRPPTELLEQSAWYNSLRDDQKRILSSIILDVADRAVFGFLCVLDGVRAIEDDADKGRLELRYIKNGATLLNPSDGEMLHDFW